MNWWDSRRKKYAHCFQRAQPGESLCIQNAPVRFHPYHKALRLNVYLDSPKPKAMLSSRTVLSTATMSSTLTSFRTSFSRQWRCMSTCATGAITEDWMSPSCAVRMQIWQHRRQYIRLGSLYLSDVIDKVIMYNYTTALGQTRRQMAQTKAEDTHIHKKAVTWWVWLKLRLQSHSFWPRTGSFALRLGYRAFYLVLSRKGNLYLPTVKWLCVEQKRGKYRLYQRRFQTLVKSAQVVFAQIPAWVQAVDR